MFEREIVGDLFDEGDDLVNDPGAKDWHCINVRGYAEVGHNDSGL